MSEADKHVKRLGQLKGARAVHEDVWRRCFDMAFPLLGDGFAGQRTTADEARAKLADRRDSTATDSGEVLAANIVGGLTPSSSLWFGLDAGQESEDERAWLDNASRVVWENIHASNYNAAAFECSLYIVAAGWFVKYIEEAEGGGYDFESWPIGQCYTTSTRRDGVVDTIFRTYSRSVAQCAATYGENNLSPRTAKLFAENKLDAQVELLHVIEPRAIHAVNAVTAKALPFKSCTYEVQDKHLLRESGYHEFPCVVPRWNVIPGTSYAVGPMFKALPDIEQLNRLVAMEDMAAELAVAGMWIAEDDGVLNPRAVKVGPRRIIVANSVDSMKPLMTGADFNVSFTKKAELQMQIRRALMADQMQPLGNAADRPDMTLGEVHARMALTRQVLGPMYGRLESEWLQRLIERCFGLALRAGALGQPPESLMGRDFTIRYLSPMARSQKLEDVSGMQAHEADLMVQAQQKPEILDTYAWDEAQRYKAELRGVPSRFIVPKKDTDAIRDARAEQMAQAQQAEQAAMTQQTLTGAAAQRMAAVA